MKKPSVTIAVPAWNEEKVIVNLLHSVVAQKQTNHKVHAICVYSDGSTDRTVELVRANFENVKVIDSKKNLGKNVRVNQIMKRNKSDVLVQMDADVTIKDDDVLDNLVASIVKDKKMGIACAYHLANKPTTFVGRISYFGFQVWDRARDSLGKRGIRYYCEGGLRAFSKEFTRNFQLPTNRHTGEDSYSFYYAIKNGFKVVVIRKAKVYIDLAENYNDYVRQMKRFLLEPELMAKSYGEQVTARFEVMTTVKKLKAFAYEFVRSPLLGFCYLVLQMIVKLQVVFYHPPRLWVPIERKKS